MIGRRSAILATAVAVAAPAAVAPPASALELVREGSVLILRGSPGEANHLSVSEDTFESFTDKLHFADRGGLAIEADPSVGCEVRNSGWGAFADCPYTGVTEVRLEGADGDDQLVVNALELRPGLKLTLDGGPGDDGVEGPTNDYPVTLIGGDGADALRGGPGADELDGGAGNDALQGSDGDDRVLGGEGDDQVAGGPRVDRDLIDGGPGTDAIVNDWSDTNEVVRPPVRVTLDGRANDGREGEGDDVRGVERILVALTATLVAGADPVEFEVEKSFEGPGSKLVGSPGADKLAGYTDDDVIDGKGGRDALAGHLGDDRMLARDGARDVVDCGDGTDVAIVDRVDVVHGCERVKVKRAKKGAKRG